MNCHFFSKKVADKISGAELRIDPQERWSVTYDIAPLKARLAGLSQDDPLYGLLLGFLDAQIVSLADGRVSPELAAHVVGRMNMIADLKSDLRKVWQDAHKPPAGAKKV